MRFSSCQWHSQPKHHKSQKGERNKRGILSIAARLDYVGHLGTGSTLTVHYHPFALVVAATAADALYSSQQTGYRSADSQSCGRGGEVCEGEASDGAQDAAGWMREAAHGLSNHSNRQFHPCLIPSCNSSLG